MRNTCGREAESILLVRETVYLLTVVTQTTHFLGEQSPVLLTFANSFPCSLVFPCRFQRPSKDSSCPTDSNPLPSALVSLYDNIFNQHTQSVVSVQDSMLSSIETLYPVDLVLLLSLRIALCT